MIGVNSVQGTSKLRRPGGSAKYGREESVRRQQLQHRSKSLKVSNSTEFPSGQHKKDKVKTPPKKGKLGDLIYMCLCFRVCLFY